MVSLFHRATIKNSLTTVRKRHNKFHGLYTAVRHICPNKSVFAHGPRLSDVANTKHFIHSVAVSKLLSLMLKFFFLAHDTIA